MPHLQVDDRSRWKEFEATEPPAWSYLLYISIRD